ncbi:MAG: M48 family metallopeptidase [Bryobacteraceae bacterium]
MRRYTKLFLSACLLAVLVTSAVAQQRRLRPGFNLFSKDQDVTLGKEAAAEIEKQYEVVNDAALNAYLERVGRKLASRPEADKYPYTFKLVNDPSINAFALPGGPTYVNTGLITAADNEAQLAGVMAHEISHVALRHGTNQATKANLIQLPAALAQAAAGQSMLGQIAKIGIGLGANSVLLSYSRSAERDADLLGARMMSGAGYNPLEMPRFFQKLQGARGSNSRVLQFLSSHPDPGNRIKAVSDELNYLPRREYRADDRDFNSIKVRVGKIPAPKKKPGSADDAKKLN